MLSLFLDLKSSVSSLPSASSVAVTSALSSANDSSRRRSRRQNTTLPSRSDLRRRRAKSRPPRHHTRSTLFTYSLVVDCQYLRLFDQSYRRNNCLSAFWRVVRGLRGVKVIDLTSLSSLRYACYIFHASSMISTCATQSGRIRSSLS